MVTGSIDLRGPIRELIKKEVEAMRKEGAFQDADANYWRRQYLRTEKESSDKDCWMIGEAIVIIILVMIIFAIKGGLL